MVLLRDVWANTQVPKEAQGHNVESMYRLISSFLRFYNYYMVTEVTGCERLAQGLYSVRQKKYPLKLFAIF